MSVIIPVRDQVELLAEALAAVRAQTYPTDRYEIIIVDNGSTPAIELAPTKQGHTRLLREPAEGCYAARNTGAACAGGDVLAFTDADCRPAPDWLDQGVRALGRVTRPALVGGRINMTVRDPEHPTVVELFDQLFYLDQQRYVARHRVAAANLLVSRPAWEAVGGFEVDVLGDFVLGRTAQRLGIPILYGELAVVDHPARRTAAQLIARQRRDARFNHELLRLRRGVVGAALMLPLQCLPPVRRYGRVLTTCELRGVKQRAAVAGYVAMSHGWFVLERLRLLSRPKMPAA